MTSGPQFRLCPHGVLGITRCVKCSREKSKRWYHAHQNQVLEYQHLHKKEHAAVIAKRKRERPETFLLTWAKYRAKTKGIKFNLDIEDIKIPKRCPVLGIELKPGKRGNPSSPSLDRHNNARGYVKGNVFVISRRANVLKGDGTLREFKKLIRYLTLK